MKLLISIILFFTLSNSYCQETIDRVEAVIGNEIILTSEIEAQYLQFISQGITSSDETKCQVIEDLLFQKLLINQSYIDSVDVTSDEVNSEVENRLNYYISQIGSVEKVEIYFKKSIKQIKKQLFDIIRDQYRAQRMKSQITNNVKVTPSEIRTYFNSLKEEEKPIIESQVVLSQLVVNALVSDIEKDKVKDQLNKFRERVISGEDFKVLAALYSEDIVSASNGGELGFVNRGELVPEFENAAFKLKNNEISEVVETKFGFHIVQLIERRGNLINVRHILIKPKISQLQLNKAKIRIDSIFSQLKSEEITFSNAVKKYSDDLSRNNDGLLINESGSKFLKNDEIDPSLSLIISDLKKGEFSSSIKMKTDNSFSGYRIIYVNDKIPSHTANLDNDYELLQIATLASKKQEKLNNWVKNHISKTFVRINIDFSTCNSQFKWIK